MMEHICDQEELEAISSEIQRVSKQFIIVVPWRFAWIEPHFKFPFFQLLPYSLKVSLVKTLNLHNLANKVAKDRQYIRQHYQWFSKAQWRDVFNADAVHISPTLETIVIVKGHE